MDSQRVTITSSQLTQLYKQDTGNVWVTTAMMVTTNEVEVTYYINHHPSATIDFQYKFSNIIQGAFISNQKYSKKTL